MARPSFSQRKRTVYGQSLVSDPLYKKQVSAWEGSSWRRAHTMFSLPAKLGGPSWQSVILHPRVHLPTLPRELPLKSEVLQTAIKTGRGRCLHGRPQATLLVSLDGGMPVLIAHNARRPCWHRCLLKCCMTREEVWRGSQTVKLLAGWLFCRLLLRGSTATSGTQFRDQLALRYNHTPVSFPKSCDGCGERFSVQHALRKKGGLVKQGHNDVRDSDVSLAEAAWGGVFVECSSQRRPAHPAVLIAFPCRVCSLPALPCKAVLLWSGTDPRPYSRVMSWVRLKSQFAIIRAVDLRLRGRRRRLFGLSAADRLGPRGVNNVWLTQKSEQYCILFTDIFFFLPVYILQGWPDS